MARRFQFSLRALLVGVVVAASVAYYVAQTAELVRQRKALRQRFENPNFCLSVAPPADGNEQLHWLRRWMGDHAVGTLVYDPSADHDGNEIRLATKLFPEAELLTLEPILIEEPPPEIINGDSPQLRNLPLEVIPEPIRHLPL